MKRRFKKGWSAIPPILRKQIFTYHHNSVNKKEKKKKQKDHD
jgi:hypothetical protein